MKRSKKVAVIRCAGCAALRAPEGNTPACTFGCLGCGECEKACPKQAITVNPGSPARIDRAACIGCGKCAKTCPQQVISLVPAENTIQPCCSSAASAKETKAACNVGCIGCGICEKACPAGAIHVQGGRAVIDQGRCIACGMCAVKCPRGVIHDANGILTV